MRYFQLKNSKAKGKRQKKIFFGFENLLVLTCGWYFKWWSVAVKFNFRFILQLFALLCHKNVFFLVNESMNWIYGDWFWLQIVGCLRIIKKKKSRVLTPYDGFFQRWLAVFMQNWQKIWINLGRASEKPLQILYFT